MANIQTFQIKSRYYKYFKIVVKIEGDLRRF